MQNKIVCYIEELLSLAIYKTKNIYEAEDIVQDTILSVLIYINKGNKIDNLRSYLITTLNGKYNDFLRKKYNKSFTYIPDNYDIISDYNIKESIIKNEEYENLRKEIAFLSKKYREIIVSHYIDGLDIKEIATKYNLNENTIKTRLHIAKDKIKEGLLNMKSYTKESYSPVKLIVNNNGNPGINGEPMSLVENNLIAQNILFNAYENPKSIEQISRELGVPTAYIEPIIKDLVKNELMKQRSGKFYTDFIIYKDIEFLKYLKDQKAFVEENFKSIYFPMESALKEIRNLTVYKELSFDQQNSLELWMNYFVFDHSLVNCLNTINGSKIEYPIRPNGGRWIAFGYSFENEINNLDYLMSKYSGERIVFLKNFIDCEDLCFRVYGTEGFPSIQYDRSPEYDFFDNNVNLDEVFAKLLYIINENKNPESLGFNVEYLKAIPWLLKCKVLRKENDKLYVNIPILSLTDVRKIYNILLLTIDDIVKNMKDLLSDFIKNKKLELPSHLENVPLRKQFHCATNSIVMNVVRKAINENKIYNGHYDEEENSIPAAMILAINK